MAEETVFVKIVDQDGTKEQEANLPLNAEITAGAAVERGGFLIGTRTAEGVHVRTAVVGEYMIERPATLTFTADTWQSAQDLIDILYPQQLIVGWFHSHLNIQILPVRFFPQQRRRQ
jgi:hypothetical protein